MSTFDDLKQQLHELRREAVVDAAVARLGAQTPDALTLRGLGDAIGASAASVHALVGGREGLEHLLRRRATELLGRSGRADAYRETARGPLGEFLLRAGPALLESPWWRAYREAHGPEARRALATLVGEAWLEHTAVEGAPIPRITPSAAGQQRVEPRPANLRIAARGTTLAHGAFVLDAATAQSLSEDPTSRPFIRPLIDAERLRGGPQRYAIGLGGRPLDQARRALALWRYLEHRVPVEQQVGTWWRHPMRRAGLYSRLEKLRSAVVLPADEPAAAQVLDPRGQLFDSTVGVIASDRVEVLAVVLCGLHGEWSAQLLTSEPWVPAAFETLPLPAPQGLEPMVRALLATPDDEVARGALRAAVLSDLRMREPQHPAVLTARDEPA